MKKVIRLTEGDLHRIVKESVKHILKEYNYDAIRSVYSLVVKACMMCQNGDMEGAINILVGKNGTSVESELIKYASEFKNSRDILTAVRNAANQGNVKYMHDILKVVKRMVGSNFSNERGDIPLVKRMGEG
jgi:hypothetical protein